MVLLRPDLSCDQVAGRFWICAGMARSSSPSNDPETPLILLRHKLAMSIEMSHLQNSRIAVTCHYI